MSVAIHLVTWNGAQYLPYFLTTLKQQSFQDFELFVLDNGSTDETPKIIERGRGIFSQPVHVSYNARNVGFAKGYNQLLRQSDADMQLIVNQDVIFSDLCLETLVRFMCWHAEASAVAPFLMRWNFNATAGKKAADKIDAVGLKAYRNRRVVEWLAGLPPDDDALTVIAKASSNKIIETFGVSGALALFRRQALLDVAFADGAVFDETYGSYKEDVDLAYRLKSMGHKTFIARDAIACHIRGGASANNLSDISGARHKRTQPLSLRKTSYVNHLATLYKNEYWQNFFLDFPWIFWYEWKKFMYFLLFDREVLGGLRDAWAKRRELKEKREWIIKKRKMKWNEMRQMFWIHDRGPE